MVLCYALRGSTGFGAAAAMPLLGLVIPLKVGIPAWTLVGLAASITLFGRDRHDVAWSYILRCWPPACLAPSPPDRTLSVQFARTRPRSQPASAS